MFSVFKAFDMKAGGMAERAILKVFFVDGGCFLAFLSNLKGGGMAERASLKVFLDDGGCF